MKRLTLFLAIFLFVLTLQGQKVLTYGGKVLRAYDANTPTSTPYTLSVWLDGKDDGSFTLDGTSVDNWADRSGNGNDVANANDDATRPTYDSSTGRVTFIAANSTFLQSAAFGSALSQPNTVFVVYKWTGAGAGVFIVTNGLTTATRHQIYIHENDFRIYSAVVLGTETANTDNNIHCGLFNGASSEYWINGVLVASGNAGTQSMDGLTLGALYDKSGNIDMELMEVIVFDGAIFDTWRDKITAYLADKWSISAITDFKGYILRVD